MAKKSKSYKKYLILLVILIVIILFFLFGARIYLIFNLLIGNDILVRVNLDKENLFLYHNQEQSIKINTNIVANPFCSVYCNYTLKDLSFDKQIESSNFSLKTITPINKEFKLKAPSLGTGQELYRFEIDCTSKKTLLCDTSEEIKSRTLLITLNYNLTQEEQEIKQSSKNNILDFSKKIGYFRLNLDNYNKMPLLTNFSDSILFKNDSKKLNLILVNSESRLSQSQDLWKSQDYNALNQDLEDLSIIINSLNKSFNDFSNKLSNYISDYNIHINKTIQIKKNLQNLTDFNLTKENSNNLSLLIDEYNELVLSFDNLHYEQRNQSITRLENKINNLLISIPENSSSNQLSKILLDFNKSFIELSFLEHNSSLSLEEPPEICCLYNKCQECCKNCSNDSSKFPILFIHGHKFNKDISADTNLHSFEAIQKTFESSGYVNSGFIFASNGIPGIWSKTNSPLSLSTSYYFDILKDSKGETILESKKDSIDVYALRLNEVVKEIKKRTGKEKVVLITHSMGGLVARRYLQIFGEQDIEKLILIMVPNNGIYGKIRTYCDVLGAEAECNDMDKDSIFIKKLSNPPFPEIPVHNIIGIGCNMEGENGDGIVANSTAYLSWAKNYYLNGTCDDLRFAFFHTDITYPNKYPELIPLLNNILKE